MARQTNKQTIQLFALIYLGPDGHEKTELYSDPRAAEFAAAQLGCAARIVEIEL